MEILVLKVPITTAVDDICNFFSLLFREIKTWFCKWILVHMKSQALFSSKDQSKELKCRSLQFLFGALRVNTESPTVVWAWGYNTFFMLNSTEHEIFHAGKC